ncbi:MAG: enoyl-CoA hydratase-related protein [Acidimicrobiales bacterium]
MSVETERRGHILVITMARTAKRNAINAAMTAGIDAALNELDDDGELRVGVLTGGDTVFCAGTDMAEGSGTPTARGGIYGIIGRRRRTPLIAAVEKMAFGGGFEIAMACDVIIAGRDARFGLPEVRRGLVPTSGGLYRAPRQLPLHVAKEAVLTGDDLHADRLERLGVVNQITEPGGALAAAMAMAGRIAANSPVAVSEALMAMDTIVAGGGSDELGQQTTRAAGARILASADRTEGIAAFFERRAPEWPGH